MNFLKIFVIIFILNLTACASKILQNRSLILKDEAGKEINACVARIYYRSSGIAFINFHRDNRPSDDDYYLMWPGEVKAGENYELVTRKKPWIIPPFVAGESYGVTGRIFLKKDFAPVVWSSYSDWENPTTIVMKRGDSEKMLNALLSKDLGKQQLSQIIGIKFYENPIPIVNRYTDDDRNFLKNCYYK